MRRELTALGGHIQDVLDAFGKYRLLTFDHEPATREPTIEVAHEALIREWDRLNGWLDESRADVRLQRLLGAAAAIHRRKVGRPCREQIGRPRQRRSKPERNLMQPKPPVEKIAMYLNECSRTLSLASAVCDSV